MRGRSQSARFLRAKRRTAEEDARRRFGKAGKGRGLSARALAVIPYKETFCREKRLLHSHSGDKFLCPSASPTRPKPGRESHPSAIFRPAKERTHEKAAPSAGRSRPRGLWGTPYFRSALPAALRKMARAVIPFRKIPRSRSRSALHPEISAAGGTASAPSGWKRPLRRRRPRPPGRPARRLRSGPRSRCG